MSIAVSLFWLLFAVLLHLALELIRQSARKHGVRHIVMESLWETKLDFALLVFALWLSVYLEFLFGVAGIGALARGGAQVSSRTASAGSTIVKTGARFAAWEGVLRSVLLTLDDVGIAIKSIITKKKKKSDPDRTDVIPTEQADVPDGNSWGRTWGIIDYIGVFLFCLTLIAIIFAPWLINVSWTRIIEIIIEEFHPFP